MTLAVHVLVPFDPVACPLFTVGVLLLSLRFCVGPSAGRYSASTLFLQTSTLGSQHIGNIRVHALPSDIGVEQDVGVAKR